MGREHQRHCVHCDQGFTPDPRNVRHQRYCAAAPCKAASKRASQAKWLAKPENHDYHRGPQAVARVQAWRQAHPGYSRRPTDTLAVTPIQETLPFDHVPAAAALAEVLASDQISCNAPAPAPMAPLQDLLNAQPIVLVGLIAHLWGSALQEDIASALTRLIQLGQDIQGGHHEYPEADPESAAPTPGARAFQLDRSPPGAGSLHRAG